MRDDVVFCMHHVCISTFRHVVVVVVILVVVVVLVLVLVVRVQDPFTNSILLRS